ncbi:MAG: hypothetical protein IPK26_12935 [Planctomycetes bacterium]|nr:hypothetical protein [Planctomycetota bacterium]
MCGIVGALDSWLRQRGLVPAVAMQAAIERLRWRGPDQAATIAAGRWWLGCARLAISGASSRQPVARRGGRFFGVSNGAITDARRLWQELRPNVARRPVLPNDAWLPLLAVAAQRPDLLADCAGHRAAAVVDAQAGTLTIAVDPLGEKPLFGVWQDLQLVAFASSPAALVAFGLVAHIDERVAPSWFAQGFSAPVLVSEDPPVQVAAWPRQALTVVPSIAPPAPPLAERSITADFPAIVHAAVLRCAAAEVPVALSLSGGIDSSCLAASLHRLGLALPAYQFQAEGEPEDERRLARSVAAHCRLPWRPVDGGPEVLSALPRLTALAGLPLGDPSILAVHALATAAAADGIRVLLGGEGGDELWFGYRRHTLARWWSWLSPWAPLLRPFADPWRRRSLDRLVAAASERAWYPALAAVVPPAFRERVLAAAPAAAPGWDGAALPAVERWELEQYLRWDLLPKVDVATMAAGVEARCPYLDPDVVAWSRAQPIASRWQKQPLRRTFAASLPPAVFVQRKRGFALPLDRWFRGELPFLDLLREARTVQRPHLRPGGVAEAIDRHRRGAADLGHALYLLVAWECHLRAVEEARRCG